MKERMGLVSNSSSSSFIIAYKAEGNVCECCGRGDIDIIDHINNSSTYMDNDVNAEGENSVLDSINQEINSGWCSDIEESRELIDIVKSKSKEGYQIASVSISYHDDFLNSEINNSKNIEILRGED